MVTQVKQLKDKHECVSYFKKIKKYKFLYKVWHNRLLIIDHQRATTWSFVFCQELCFYAAGRSWRYLTLPKVFVIWQRECINKEVQRRGFDGTEISELIVMYLLSILYNIVHINNHSIYRDEGIIAVHDNKKANQEESF